MKAYKYKIRRPTRRVVERLEQTLSVCCELYNAALQERREAWTRQRVSINYNEQSAQLPEIKAIREDAGAIHSQVLQATLRRLQRSFENFFGRVKRGEKAGFPRFRSRSRYDSFTYPQSGFRLDGDKLHLSKVGSVRLYLSRPIEGKIKTCTIKREVTGWFVIFAVEENQCRYILKTGASVGVDVGLENFATLSTGETIANPQFLRRAERCLKTIEERKPCACWLCDT